MPNVLDSYTGWGQGADDGCEHDDYSSGADANSPSNDDGGGAEGDGDGGR